jgi:hypothetical protein
MSCNLFYFQKHCPKSNFFESFRWGIIPLDLMGFSFRTSKSKNDINYIKYQFSHRFGKVCRWLNVYHSDIRILIFYKVTTMSIWIILKNLVWAYKECIFCCFWATVQCIHLIRNVNSTLCCKHKIVVNIFLVRRCYWEKRFRVYPLKIIEFMAWIFQEGCMWE